MNELFLKIINMSVSASLLVLAVLILRPLLKKAPKWINVLLWGIVAVRLICPFAIESPVSLIPGSIGSGELVSQWTNDYIGDIDIHHPDSVYYDAAIGAGREPISDGEGGYYVVTKHDQLGEPSTIENTVLPVLSVVWLTGIAALLVYTAISYWRLRRKVDTAVLYKDNIFQSENAASPFVLGIVKTRIYLPYKMNCQDLEYVVAHEQAHIRRKDHWWKPLGFLLLTIHWFNPMMWLAYALLCRDIELACDEKVIKELGSEQRADYTQALVTCSVNHHRITACPLAFGEVGVRERVKSVMNYQKPALRSVILALLACMVAAVCFLTNPLTSVKNPWVQESIPGTGSILGNVDKEEAQWVDDVDGLDVRIRELLDEICVSPGTASSPVQYIEAHDAEYQELQGYGEYTLRYCFSEFLSGDRTDLRGHIMAAVCEEISGTWGEALLTEESAPATGQDWFDDFYRNARRLADQFSDEEMEKNYPASWLLLQMIDE